MARSLILVSFFIMARFLRVGSSTNLARFLEMVSFFSMARSYSDNILWSKRMKDRDLKDWFWKHFPDCRYPWLFGDLYNPKSQENSTCEWNKKCR
jgi:hypothetical protein